MRALALVVLLAACSDDGMVTAEPDAAVNPIVGEYVLNWTCPELGDSCTYAGLFPWIEIVEAQPDGFGGGGFSRVRYVVNNGADDTVRDVFGEFSDQGVLSVKLCVDEPDCVDSTRPRFAVKVGGGLEGNAEDKYFNEYEITGIRLTK